MAPNIFCSYNKMQDKFNSHLLSFNYSLAYPITLRMPWGALYLTLSCDVWMLWIHVFVKNLSFVGSYHKTIDIYILFKPLINYHQYCHCLFSRETGRWEFSFSWFRCGSKWNCPVRVTVHWPCKYTNQDLPTQTGISYARCYNC